MAAAWLLSKRHEVTVFERDRRIGGHSNTVLAEGVPVDTGFIVFNEATYPNLTALFAHIGVATHASEMSFAVSLYGGRLEYSGTGLAGLAAQPTNLFRPRFWSMLVDLLRFYRGAKADAAALEAEPDLTLAEYLERHGYGPAFIDDHLLPMASAIWSGPPELLRTISAAAFIRFQKNHGLLELWDRPVWRSVVGGSRAYVKKLTADYADRIHVGAGALRIVRTGDGVLVHAADSTVSRFDAVVLATHADQALALLDAPTTEERRLLGAIRYTPNRAVLHTDEALMPHRKVAWASWNYLGAGEGVTVTYWMNRLQQLPTKTQLFVTLNPDRPIRDGAVLHVEDYEHPVFDAAALRAQQSLWSLQGVNRVWYCGAWFGAGFHEDGLQSALAVAEELGGVRRPWSVADESSRIVLPHNRAPLGRAA
jgi:predicted NAD/FAD-binding protein